MSKFLCGHMFSTLLGMNTHTHTHTHAHTHTHTLSLTHICGGVSGLVTKLCLILCDSRDYIACQAPLSMGFPRQEYWSRLPFPSLGDLPNLGTEPTFPALAGRFFTTEPLEIPSYIIYNTVNFIYHIVHYIPST